jgi:hypothetical protein
MQHNFWKLSLLGCAMLAGNALARTAVINNTNVPEPAAWAEDSNPQAAPMFTREHLLPLDMPVHLSIKAGIDPDTISVGKDSVVRYVVVITNNSGSVMAAYEGIRCDTREVKTYARQTSSGRWRPVIEPVWVDLNATMPSHHAQVFAQQGACQGGLTQSKSEIINTMKNGRPAPTNINAY